VTVSNNIATETNTSGAQSGFWNGGGCEPVTLTSAGTCLAPKELAVGPLLTQTNGNLGRGKSALTRNDPVNIALEKERRRTPRFSWVVEMKENVLSADEISKDFPDSLKAVTEDISAGGVAILADQALPANAVLRCEFAVPGGPAVIPTLMQVRWSESVGGKRRCKLGLRFLL
jgi:PilZ domain-containing protein